MLQVEKKTSPCPSQVEFPAPARDLERASIRRTALAAPPISETVASATLDELDSLLEDATGQYAVSKILKAFETDKARAVDAFADAHKRGAAADIIAGITGVSSDRIRNICPEICNASPGTPEEVRPMTRELITKIVNEGNVPLRELAIGSIAEILSAQTAESVSRKAEVTKEFDNLMNAICNPGASEMALFAAGRLGKSFLPALAATGRGLLAASEATGIFLFYSTVAQNLPAWVKPRFERLDDRASDAFYFGTTGISILFSGAAQGLIVRHILAANGEAATTGGAITAGILLELVSRLAVGAFNSFEGAHLPGMTLLEIAGVPLKLLAMAGKAIAKNMSIFREDMRDERRKTLEDKGLLGLKR